MLYSMSVKKAILCIFQELTFSYQNTWEAKLVFDIEDLCLGERQSENKVIISYMSRTEREKTGNISTSLSFLFLFLSLELHEGLKYAKLNRMWSPKLEPPPRHRVKVCLRKRLTGISNSWTPGNPQVTEPQIKQKQKNTYMCLNIA